MERIGREQAGGLEAVGAEDLRVGVEGDGGAATVRGGADLGDRAEGQAAREPLLPELAVARDLDDHRVRQRVDDGGADAVQTARGLVGLARELAAGVQRAEDDLERGLVGELGVRIDGDAAAVVGHGDGIVGVQRHLDPVGVARDGLVHRIVEHLGDQVVQRAFVGAADVHAGTLAHGLQPFEHLDRGGVVGVGRGPLRRSSGMGRLLSWGVASRIGEMRARRKACRVARVRGRSCPSP